MTRKLIRLGFGTQERNETARVRVVSRLVTLLILFLVMILPYWMKHHSAAVFASLTLSVFYQTKKAKNTPTTDSGHALDDDTVIDKIKLARCKVEMGNKYHAFSCGGKAFKKSLKRAADPIGFGNTCTWLAKSADRENYFRTKKNSRVVEEKYEADTCEKDLTDLLRHNRTKSDSIMLSFLYLALFGVYAYSLYAMVLSYERPDETQLKHLLAIDCAVLLVSFLASVYLISAVRTSSFGRVPPDSHDRYFEQALHRVIAYALCGANIACQAFTTYGSRLVLEQQKSREHVLTDKERAALHQFMELTPLKQDDMIIKAKQAAMLLPKGNNRRSRRSSSSSASSSSGSSSSGSSASKNESLEKDEVKNPGIENRPNEEEVKKPEHQSFSREETNPNIENGLLEAKVF